MSNKSMSRRDFLKVAGLTLAAATVTCSGLGYAATRTPEIETPELNYGKENPMNKRILVTYATRAGSTVEVAAAIGESLNQRGFAVDVKPVKAKPSLNGYDAVVLGSAIRMGGWLPEMVDFVKANQFALNTLPVALFTVHMLNIGDDEQSRTNRLAYLSTVRPLLQKADEVYFAGKMDFSRLSFLDRFISGMVKVREEDRRDWDNIRNWAQTILA
ncbi:MAG: flavodoxin domain-containing protein [Anaerolineales bacterium]|nr:flavodoxin domain-containing protein [Anaerolineales bacterium]